MLPLISEDGANFVDKMRRASNILFFYEFRGYINSNNEKFYRLITIYNTVHELDLFRIYF